MIILNILILKTKSANYVCQPTELKLKKIEYKYLSNLYHILYINISIISCLQIVRSPLLSAK